MPTVNKASTGVIHYCGHFLGISDVHKPFLPPKCCCVLLEINWVWFWYRLDGCASVKILPDYCGKALWLAACLALTATFKATLIPLRLPHCVAYFLAYMPNKLVLFDLINEPCTQWGRCTLNGQCTHWGYTATHTAEISAKPDKVNLLVCSGHTKPSVTRIHQDTVCMLLCLCVFACVQCQLPNSRVGVYK